MKYGIESTNEQGAGRHNRCKEKIASWRVVLHAGNDVLEKQGRYRMIECKEVVIGAGGRKW
jgi:hypothetical protein